MVKKFLILLGILIVGFLLGKMSSIYSPKEKLAGIPLVSQTNEVNCNSAASKYSEKVTFPRIETGVPSADAERFNTLAKDIVDQAVAEFKGEFASGDCVIGSPTPSKSSDETWMDANYQVERADTKVISVRLNFSWYGAGAAHPNSFSKAINYSLTTHKEMLLSDLLIDNPGYLDTLSQAAKRRIEEGYRKDGQWDDNLRSFVNEGAGPDLNNFKMFLIGKDYLLIIFDPYTVGPASAGTREAKIPFSDLKGILRVDLME